MIAATVCWAPGSIRAPQNYSRKISHIQKQSKYNVFWVFSGNIDVVLVARTVSSCLISNSSLTSVTLKTKSQSSSSQSPCSVSWFARSLHKWESTMWTPVRILSFYNSLILLSVPWPKLTDQEEIQTKWEPEPQLKYFWYLFSLNLVVPSQPRINLLYPSKHICSLFHFCLLLLLMWLNFPKQPHLFALTKHIISVLIKVVEKKRFVTEILERRSLAQAKPAITLLKSLHLYATPLFDYRTWRYIIKPFLEFFAKSTAARLPWLIDRSTGKIFKPVLYFLASRPSSVIHHRVLLLQQTIFQLLL